MRLFSRLLCLFARSVSGAEMAEEIRAQAHPEELMVAPCTRQAPEAVRPALHAAVSGVDPDLLLCDVKTMETLNGRAMQGQHFCVDPTNLLVLADTPSSRAACLLPAERAAGLSWIEVLRDA